MFFTSLEQTLAKLTHQPSWEQYQQYRELLNCWQQIVSKEINKQTRPLYIDRNVLGVATSSSVWAQELTLQRYTLLKKLNSQLTFSLKDIRFSPSQWQTSDRNLLAQSNQDSHSMHPSRININAAQISDNSELRTPNSETVAVAGFPRLSKLSNLKGKLKRDDPQAVVQCWINALQVRSPKLSICPQCQSPTPEGELKRWSLCCHCAAKNWSDK